MSGAQKRQYFLDYYLLRTVIIVSACAAVILLIWNFTKPEEKPLLYAAVFDETLTDEKLNPLRTSLMDDFGADGRNTTVVLNSNFDSSSDGPSRLAIYMNARQIDVVIAEKDVIQQLAGEGIFTDIASVPGADEFPGWQKDIVEAPGYDETESDAYEYDGTSRGKILPYGIKLSGSALWKATGSSLKDPVLAFAQNSQNQDNAVHFLKKLLAA